MMKYDMLIEQFRRLPLIKNVIDRIKALIDRIGAPVGERLSGTCYRHGDHFTSDLLRQWLVQETIKLLHSL